jgi:hypothetical protein
MKRVAIGLVAALAWGGLAQAAPIRIEPVQTLGSPVQYREGMAGARSSLARSEAAIVVVRETLDEKDPPMIALAVKNFGQAAFNLTRDNVEVRVDGQLQPVFTRAEMVTATLEAARKRERRARMLAALDGAGAAMRDRPTRPNPAFERDIVVAQVEGAEAVEAAHEYGFVAQTVEPGEDHSTDLGLGPLPKGASELTIVVSVGQETHTFPLKISRYR